MAYKFQLGQAIMSGALVQEGQLDVYDASGNQKFMVSQTGVVSGSGAAHFVGALTAGSTLAVTGAITVGSDGAGADVTFNSATSGDYMMWDASEEKLIIEGTNGATALDITDGNVSIGDGDLSVAGNVDLGNATSDTITATGRFDSDLVPSSDSARDLGTTALQWAEAHIDTGHIDTVTAVNVDGILGANTAAAATVTTLSATGDVDLGNATSDTITCTGQFDSDLIPSTDSARDLGTSAKQWAELHVDTGHIDALGSALNCASQAMTNVNIDSGNIDGTAIGASSASTIVGTTVSGSGQLSGLQLLLAPGKSIGVVGDTDLMTLTSGQLSVAGILSSSATLKGHAIVLNNDQNIGIAADTDLLQLKSGILKVAGEISGSGLLQMNGAATFGGDLKVSGSTTLAGANTIAAADTALDVAADSVYFRDADGVMKRDSFADLASAQAGDGLAASSGVLAVGAGSLIDVQANQVDVDLTEAGEAAIASGDYMLFLDGGATGTAAKENIDDIASLFAGAGLTASSAVLAVVNATNGGLSVAANDVKVDLNDLSAAAVDVAADSIAIVDANDSNASRKESIADLVSAMAGAGLTATDGVLSSDASPTPQNIGDSAGTLKEGFNYSSAVFSAARTWTLPASPDAGDRVTVKAPSNASTYNLTIARAGSQTIDGATSVILESPYASVSLTFVGSDTWLLS
tara:strand:- start:3845 stop:5923 length:2079 start_codon:yes stop_codon:yes gene_type:complete